jgi:hypothetical protein
MLVIKKRKLILLEPLSWMATHMSSSLAASHFLTENLSLKHKTQFGYVVRSLLFATTTIE